MPKNLAIKKVLVIGSGPIIIGQAAEFDYAGTQACKALREEGISVVLVNSNPATIMTDEEMADRVYIEPLTVDAISKIIEKEKPDGLLPTLGGQTGLNLAAALDKAGVLKKFNVEVLGTPLRAIQQAEDRDEFKALMEALKEPIATGEIVTTVEDALKFAEKIGYPVIVRPAFTLGGTGGGMAYSPEELTKVSQSGLLHSPIGQVLIEQSLLGWKEIEYEVMRDSNDTCITVCNMENFDPVGVHTGDSIVVAPSQTLRDTEYHLLRTSALRIIRALKIEGGCNVQYAFKPDSLDYRVIEVNPRVSRSSALASKAAGYPIAKIAAKIAVGLQLDEIPNAITGKTLACFEPALDYIVTKIPRWPFDKFTQSNRKLGSQMKATGEVMAIDRTFERSLLKAIDGLEIGLPKLRYLTYLSVSKEELLTRIKSGDDLRLFLILAALYQGVTAETIHETTKIDHWFLSKLVGIVTIIKRVEANPQDMAVISEALMFGFTKEMLLEINPKVTTDAPYKPVYKIVDSCAGEFEAKTPYYYASVGDEDENIPSDREKVLVVGSGPIRIGQGVEFDYCAVHAAWALQQANYEALMINNNPETVSTDFDTADKLYFEPLSQSALMQLIDAEKPTGVMLQFGGQTAINQAKNMVANGVKIWGTSSEATDLAEDRDRFESLLHDLNIPRPRGKSAYDWWQLQGAIEEIGYPLLVRPSYVIGGQAMKILTSDEDFKVWSESFENHSIAYPILVDKYLEGIEVEVDAISDGHNILIPGLMAHIERAGVHSGDSFSVYPARDLSETVTRKLVHCAEQLAKALPIVGLFNIQFIVANDDIYVIELNPRASRTVPILSKVTGVPMVQLAVQVMLGAQLKSLGYGTGLLQPGELFAVKSPVFSFQKLPSVDPAVSPEMKSTGEALGIDTVYEQALLKAFEGAGFVFYDKPGKILVSLADADQDRAQPVLDAFVAAGFQIVNPQETDEIHLPLRNQEFSLILNTAPSAQDFQIRTLAAQYRVPCFTAIETAEAYLQAMAERKKSTQTVRAVSDYKKAITSQTLLPA